VATLDMEFADDIHYHRGMTLNWTVAPGQLVVPVFRNKDNAGKTLYYSWAYEIINTSGGA